MSDYVDEPLPANEVAEEPDVVAVNANEVEVEEPAPVEVEEPTPVEEEPVEEDEPVEEEPVEEEPVEEEPVEEEPAPVEQFASDIREILTPVAITNDVEAAEVSSSSGLSDDLKQRIAELDFLRECCGDWVGSDREGKSNFLTAWNDRSIAVDSNVNYENTLDQLEKLPELVKSWNLKIINFKTNNYFQTIETYTLEKPLFKDNQNNIQKIELLEQLITLLIDSVNMKYKKNKIGFYNFIDNLY